MALPRTVSYTMPSSRWPQAALPWQPHSDRSALLVHDMQAYFTSVYAPDCPAYATAVARTAELIESARGLAIPVVYTAQPGAQDPASRGLLTDRWGPGIGDDPAVTTIIEPLAPRGSDVVLTKHRYSAFARTDLEAILRDQGRDQLVITGIYGHIGIAATATDAFMRDIAPFVAADAIADFSAEDHLAALRHVAATCGVTTSAAEIMAAWSPQSSWDAWLAGQIGQLLNDDHAGASLLADPARSLFEAGLDSMRAFSLLDELADRGIEVDFVDFAAAACAGFLLDEIARSGVPAP